ncbi:MAG: 30S ribosomal protein S16, partial [Clostridia bacterium]|nr:30S ribosomal protein S16 [Clostridia bacterium]
PKADPSAVKVDADKVREWIKNGAQPTETVRTLLKKENIL